MTTGRADLVDDDHHGSIVRWWPTPDADPVSIHPVWLLESCVCERCRYPATGRRRREALLVSTDRSPSRVWFDGAHLRAEWADGHLTVTVPPSGPIDGGGSAPPGSPPESVSGRSLATVAWGAGDMVEQESAEQESAERESAEQESAEQESVEQQSIDETVGTTASATVGEIVAALLSDGAVVVTGVPTNEAALLALARRFGPIRPSGYGDVWEIDTTAETGSAAPDAVTSLDGLSPHTDLPYRQLPPGVQFLLSCVAEGVGGASTLVDGRRVVAQLDADDLRTLMEVPVRYGFGPVEEPVENGRAAAGSHGEAGDGEPSFRTVRHDHIGPVVELDASGVLSILRHAPGLIEDLDPDPDRFARLHRALSNLTALTNDRVNQIVHRLEPGELLIFDNHRMLHGRTPVELAAGERRHLLGLYLDRDEVAGMLVGSDRAS